MIAASTCSTFLSELFSFLSDITRVTVFRGQADKSWDALPTIYRRFLHNGYQSHQITENLVAAYEHDILSESNGLGFYDGSRLQTMINLQHYGGATRLLDITRNPLTALWFATDQHHDQTPGRIIIYQADPTAVAMSEAITSWDQLTSQIPPGQALFYFPDRNNERVKAQQAGFLSGHLADSLDHGSPYNQGTDLVQRRDLIIASSLKQPLRDYLRTKQGMHSYTIFPDIQGFSLEHSSDSEFPRSYHNLYSEESIFPREFTWER